MRGSTLSSCASLIRQQLKPCFSRVRLSVIGDDQVQRLANEAGAAMAPETVHNALILLRVMLAEKRGGSAIRR